MNKKVLVFAAVLFVAGVTQGHALGLGVQFGGFYYDGGYDGNASLLISPSQKLHGAIDWNFNGSLISGSLDYWFLEGKISGPFSWYVGGGLGAWIGGFGDIFLLGIAPRLPIGIDLKLKPFDIFFQIVPQLGIGLAPEFYMGGLRAAGNLGIRFWF